MLDTMIHDKLDAEPEIRAKLIRLTMQARIELLTTHIQQDELSEKKGESRLKEQKLPTEGNIVGISRLSECKVGDGKRKQESDSLAAKKVPTSGAIYGVSKYGDCTYGTGLQSGISIDDVKTSQGNQLEDALIATTASSHADILVTEDKRLRKRLDKIPIRCKVFSFADFKKLIIEIS
jgi:predicted nucleic acid-binding protein